MMNIEQGPAECRSGVIPAEAGIQGFCMLKHMDPGFRRDDVISI